MSEGYEDKQEILHREFYGENKVFFTMTEVDAFEMYFIIKTKSLTDSRGGGYVIESGV